MTQILQLDAAGAPADWLTFDRAAYYVAKNMVAWELGETCMVLRGGNNAITGKLSTLEIKPIISVKCSKHVTRAFKEPAFHRDVLLRRDRLMCAYCGDIFKDKELTLDHVQPESRGGQMSWMNIVASCKSCNNRKDARTPEEAKMPLLYVPYVPNLHEKFILENHKCLADQMDFLMRSVPRHSRLHA